METLAERTGEEGWRCFDKLIFIFRSNCRSRPSQPAFVHFSALSRNLQLQNSYWGTFTSGIIQPCNHPNIQ